MWIAVVNNLGEIVMGTAWTGLSVYAGVKVGMWRVRRKLK